MTLFLIIIIIIVLDFMMFSLLFVWLDKLRLLSVERLCKQNVANFITKMNEFTLPTAHME